MDELWMSKMFGHRNNQKHHAAQAPYGARRQWPPVPVQGDRVKIYYCKADTDYRFRNINGHADPNQQWIMDALRSVTVMDEAGFPAFVLINKATGQVLRNGKDENERVTLGSYNPEEVVFKQSTDVGKGYQCVRPMSNIHLNLNTKIGDGKHHDISKEGAEIVLSKKWKISRIDCFKQCMQSRYSRNMASLNYPKIWLCCLCIISLLFSATATVTGHSWSTNYTVDNSCPLGNCSCCIRESDFALDKNITHTNTRVSDSIFDSNTTDTNTSVADFLVDTNITDSKYDPNKNKNWIKACEFCDSTGGPGKWKNWCCFCCCQEITCRRG